MPFTRPRRQAGVPVASVECRGKPPGGDGHAPVREKSLARVDDRGVSPFEPATPAQQCNSLEDRPVVRRQARQDRLDAGERAVLNTISLSCHSARHWPVRRWFSKGPGSRANVTLAPNFAASRAMGSAVVGRL